MDTEGNIIICDGCGDDHDIVKTSECGNYNFCTWCVGYSKMRNDARKEESS